MQYRQFRDLASSTLLMMFKCRLLHEQMHCYSMCLAV